MTIYTQIDTGTVDDDGSGDTLRAAFDKVNYNLALQDVALTLDEVATPGVFTADNDIITSDNDRISADATPAAKGKIWVRDDSPNVLVFTDDTGAETVLGGGGASPLTTKGDLFTYDTVDQRLAIGTNTFVLTADSTEDTGMKWAAAAGGGAALEIQDEGISISSAVEILNFTGTGVTVTADFGDADISLSTYPSKSADIDSLISVTNPSDVVIRPDGNKMFVSDLISDDVFQFSLPTNSDVNGATYDTVSFSLSAQAEHFNSITFKRDSSKLYGVSGWSRPTSAFEEMSANFDGVDGATSYTEESNSRVATFISSAALSATSKFGSTSLSLDGVDDYITFPDSDDFNIGLSDFCVEAWVRFNVVPSSQNEGGSCIAAHYKNVGNDRSWAFTVDTADTVRIFFSTDGIATTFVVSPVQTWAIDRWYHLAVTREGNVVRLFKDGVKIHEETISAADLHEPTQPLRVGAVDSSVGFRRFTDGYIDNFRFTVGDAVYTAAFDPFVSDIFQYTLPTPGILTGTTYDSKTLEVPIVDGSMDWSSDGTKFYTLDSLNPTVSQYSASTAFDIDTGTSDSVTLDVSAQVSNPRSIRFNSGGTKFYIIDADGKIYQYALILAWNLNTASYESLFFDTSAQDNDPAGFYMKLDETQFYVAGNQNDTVFQYDTNRPVGSDEKMVVTIPGNETDERIYGRAGVLTIFVGNSRWYPIRDITITELKASVGSPPTVIDMLINIKKNGTLVVTDLTISATNFQSVLDTTVITLTTSDYITVDVTQIGTGEPGADLTINFKYT